MIAAVVMVVMVTHAARHEVAAVKGRADVRRCQAPEDERNSHRCWEHPIDDVREPIPYGEPRPSVHIEGGQQNDVREAHSREVIWEPGEGEENMKADEHIHRHDVTPSQSADRMRSCRLVRLGFGVRAPSNRAATSSTRREAR